MYVVCPVSTYAVLCVTEQQYSNVVGDDRRSAAFLVALIESTAGVEYT